jgi:hypothetical protein
MNDLLLIRYMLSDPTMTEAEARRLASQDRESQVAKPRTKIPANARWLRPLPQNESSFPFAGERFDPPAA